MATYLEDNPPKRSQFRRTRKTWTRASDGARITGPSGAIVVHTPENIVDLRPPDDGAENVARFISTRTDAAGSYHSIADSDSVVRVGRYEWQMFGEGTGGNRWALHLAGACKAHQWETLPEWWVVATIRNMAREARQMADWVHQETGVFVPAEPITAAQYRRGEPGFISHGELDPGRRSDPGKEFPWDQFLADYAELDEDGIDWIDALPYEQQIRQLTTRLQRQLIGLGADLGRFGPNRDGVDGDPGPTTLKAAMGRLDHLQATIAQLQLDKEALELRIDNLLAEDNIDTDAAEKFRRIEPFLASALNHHLAWAGDLGEIRESLEG